jgi:hypothetical protein
MESDMVPVLQLSTNDFDGDGISDDLDPDDDNDGIVDSNDAAPNDPAVPGTQLDPAPDPIAPDQDTDGDTIPNDLDPDDSNDGVTDAEEIVATAVPTSAELPTPSPESTSVPTAIAGEPAPPDTNGTAPVEVPEVTALPSTGSGDKPGTVGKLMIAALLLVLPIARRPIWRYVVKR